ncbi:MAG: biliverdin-producing heme oxygenase [Pseudomonadota bacterium]
MDDVASLETRRGYQAMLGVLHAAYTQLTPVLDGALVALGIPARHKALTSALETDLRALGSSIDRLHLLDPVHWSADEALGAAYVMEGSALGSQLLRKRLVEYHTADIPHTYFDTVIAVQPQRWRDVVAALNCVHADREATLSGALATFTLLGNLAQNVALTNALAAGVSA